MVSRSVISLTLSALLLSSVSQFAFASGCGSGEYTLQEEKGEVQKRKKKLNFLNFLGGRKKEELTPTTQISSSSVSNTKKEKFDIESEPKKATPPYVFHPNYPPQPSEILAYEEKWIPHFLETPNAIDPNDYYKLILNTDNIQNLFQAPKGSQVPEDSQTTKVSENRSYIPIGEVLEGSLRTTVLDSEWQKIFQENPECLYAVFVNDVYRNKTTNHGKKKDTEKPGTLVKYAAFRWKNEKISAIYHPVEKSILTFSVSYRKRD